MIKAIVIAASLHAPVPAAAPLAASAQPRHALENAAGSSWRLRYADNFAATASGFDRSARLKTAATVDEFAFRAHLGNQALDWSPAEEAQVRSLLASIEAKLAAAFPALKLRNELMLYKTTGLEEGRLPYGREIAIVVPQKALSNQKLEDLLAAEVYHFLDIGPVKQRALHKVIGFETSPLRVIPPASLAGSMITHPSFPLRHATIVLPVDQTPTRLVPVTFSKLPRWDPARGGEVVDYQEVRLMALDAHRRPQLLPDGSPRLLEPRKVPGYEAAVGRNTPRIHHPKAILADNFVLALNGATNVPSPSVLQRIAAVLAAP